MTELLVRIIVAGGILGILDGLWLGLVASKLYKSQLGSMMLDKPNVFAAGAFYLIYLTGILIFVINPALEKSSWHYALGMGALFGLVAYATFGLTNLSVLRGFTPKLVITDMAWGAFLTAAVSVITYWGIKTWFS